MKKSKGIQRGYVNEHMIHVLTARTGDDPESKAEPVGVVILNLPHPDLSEGRRCLLVNYQGKPRIFICTNNDGTLRELKSTRSLPKENRAIFEVELMRWSMRVELTEAAAFEIFDLTVPLIETGLEGAFDEAISDVKATAREEWVAETMERLETLVMASS